MAPLEAVASIGAAPYQHLGLVTSFDAEWGNHWALFSTWYTTDRLFARVNANGSSVNIDIGPRPSGFHTYKVQPTAGGFDFFIDGVLMTSIAAGFQSTVAMKAGLSDYTGTAGELLRVERVSFDSYSTTTSGASMASMDAIRRTTRG